MFYNHGMRILLIFVLLCSNVQAETTWWNKVISCKKAKGSDYFRRHTKRIGECFNLMDGKKEEKNPSRPITVFIGAKHSYKIEDGKRLEYTTYPTPHTRNGGDMINAVDRSALSETSDLYQHWDCYDDNKSYFIGIHTGYLVNGSEIPATYFIECVKH